MSDQTTTAEGTDRRTLVILLSVLGGIAVLALLWFFVLSPLLAGDEEQEPVAQPPPPVTTPQDGATTPDVIPTEEGEGAVTLPVETYEIFLARDPFEPIRPESAPDGNGNGTADDGNGDGNGTDDGNGDGNGTDDGNGDGTADDDGDGVPNGSDDDDGVDTDDDGQDDDDLPPTNGGEDDDDDGTQDREQVDRHEVVLIDVFEEDGSERAVVQVDSTSYTVGEGDTFAESFRALSIDGPCATFLYGDNRFQLCEGDRVMK